MTAWTVYFLLKLDSIANLFEVGIGLTVGAVIVNGVIMGVRHTDGPAESRPKIIKTHLKIYKFLITPIFVFFCIARALIPTTKEMAVIYVTPKIVNAVTENEALEKIPKNLINLANSWIEELKPEKQENKK